jgi:hypothetical protein
MDWIVTPGEKGSCPIGSKSSLESSWARKYSAGHRKLFDLNSAILTLRSNALELVNGAFILYVACVERGRRLEQNDPAFVRGYGPMLDAARHDNEFTFFDPLVRMIVMVAELHAEAAFDDEKHFVFVVMMVEDEFAVELYELDLLTVEFGSDAGLVVVGDFREFLGDVDFGHGILEGSRLALVVWMRRGGKWSRKFASSRRPTFGRRG